MKQEGWKELNKMNCLYKFYIRVNEA